MITNTVKLDTSTWKKVKLGDIIIKMPKASHAAKDALDNGKYPFFTNSASDKEFFIDDIDYKEPIILANTGGKAYFKYCDKPCGASRDLYVFKTINGVNTKWLYYQLKQLEEQINEFGFAGAALKHLQKDYLHNLEINLPSEEDQLKIAKILSEYDELIQTKRTGLANIEKSKAQLMNSIFTERESLEWTTHRLEDICNVRNGYTPSKSVAEYWENGTVPWYRVDDIRENGRVLTDALQHVNECAVKGGKLIPANSIMISTSATIGEYALTKVDCLGNQRFAFFTVKDEYKDKIDTTFLLYSFDSVAEWCKANASMGSTFLQVSTADLKKCKISLPPLSEQKRVAKLLSEYDELIKTNDNESETLIKSKTQLMNSIFTEREREFSMEDC